MLVRTLDFKEQMKLEMIKTFYIRRSVFSFTESICEWKISQNLNISRVNVEDHVQGVSNLQNNNLINEGLQILDT